MRFAYKIANLTIIGLAVAGVGAPANAQITETNFCQQDTALRCSYDTWYQMGYGSFESCYQDFLRECEPGGQSYGPQYYPCSFGSCIPGGSW